MIMFINEINIKYILIIFYYSISWSYKLRIFIQLLIDFYKVIFKFYNKIKYIDIYDIYTNFQFNFKTNNSIGFHDYIL